MTLKTAGLAVFIIISPALACQPFLNILSLSEIVHYYANVAGRPLSPDDVVSYRRNPESLETLQSQLKLLANKSLPVLLPCDIGDYAGDECQECKAPPVLPLFPLLDSDRNTLLGRPSPDVVQANIERATHGELSTVPDLIEKVTANLGNLSALHDDELAVLASNFHQAKSGWNAGTHCEPTDYGGWPWDLLVPQDEQRALVAAFLYATRDFGYRTRQVDALRQESLRYAREVKEMAVKNPQEYVWKAINSFIESMTRLHREVIVTEEQWLARYDEYLAVLRAKLHRIADAALPTQELRDKNTPALEEVVDAAEEKADTILCGHLPPKDSGFFLFRTEQRDMIQKDLPGVRGTHVDRIAYSRWKALPDERQAPYIVEAKLRQT